MLKKIINYYKRDLDFPVEANKKSKFIEENHYFLDLTRIFNFFPFNHIVFDHSGIVCYDYSQVKQLNQSLGIQYNNTYICWWALSRLEIFLNTEEQVAREEFFKHVDWLLKKHQKRNGFVVWPLQFDYCPAGNWLRAPWVSGMDQGLIISVLIRAYKIGGDQRYLELAKRAGLFYKVPLENGGFRAQFSKGDYYYEMYPTRPLSKILDGFLFSLMGLYDLLSVWKDECILNLYEEGLNTLLKHVKFWDFHGFWSRFGIYYLSPPWYHKLNYAWLKVIFDLTKDSRLIEIVKNWDPERISRLEKAQVKLYSYLFSRKKYISLWFQKYFLD